MISKQSPFRLRVTQTTRRMPVGFDKISVGQRRGLVPVGIAAIALVALGAAGLTLKSRMQTALPVEMVALTPAGAFAAAPVSAVSDAIPAPLAPVLRTTPQPIAAAHRPDMTLAMLKREIEGQQQAETRRLMALYKPSVEGTALPSGLRLIAGAPAAVPPARPVTVRAETGLRPIARPETGEAAPLLRPQARPGAVALTLLDQPRVMTVDRQVAVPAPRVADLTRPNARPEGLVQRPAPAAVVPALAAVIRPSARPETLARRVAMQVRRPAQTASAGVKGTPVAMVPSAKPRRQVSGGCPASLSRDIPRRARGAVTGSALAARMQGLQGADRDRLIAQELISGNMPSFLRVLTPVTASGQLPDGRATNVTICVTPDYLALGSDGDFLRVPMGLPAAAQIADRFGFLLPTTRMVDAIYAQAGLRLSPRPMTPGSQMTSTSYFRQHNQTVENQTRGREGLLTAGQKKDLVLTNRLRRNPGRVAIYGWHQPNGRPIQPLSTVHGALYADYSHGVRLVSATAYVDGRAVSLADLLADPTYASILSNEGPIPATERLMASLYR